MFRTPVDGFFPDFLKAQNVVRVIEGKITVNVCQKSRVIESRLYIGNEYLLS